MPLPLIRLNSKIKNFHTRQIFYSNEINHLDPACLDQNGATLAQYKDQLVLYSKHHLMAARLTQLSVELIETIGIAQTLLNFLTQLHTQKRLFKFVQEGEAYRLCHGDHDGLPGITIDCYGKTNVVQSSSGTSDLLIPHAVEALSQLMSEIPVFERSSGQIREIEKLKPVTQWRYLSDNTTQHTTLASKILSFDLINGQKTGLFIDQRLNLLALKDYLLTKMTSMLDICSYMGAWSVAASEVIQNFTLIDQSKVALDMAKLNIIQNNTSPSTLNIDLRHGDMFDELKLLKSQGSNFDLIIADPPAFAKSKKHINEAKRAYQRLFKLALSCLNKEGIFVACSCSRHIDEGLFFDIIQSLSYDLILLHKGYSSPCHTQAIQVDYHDYLKCYIFKLR